MIEFDGVVELDKKDMLPDGPGIYFVCDSDGNVLYVGKSVNIHNRWLSHHRYNQAKSIEQVVIKWKQCDAVDLDLKEAYFIETLSPEWNGTSIYRSESTQGEFDASFQRTNIYLADVDREAAQIIMAQYGLTSQSSAVRLALRKLAQEIASMDKGKDDGN